MDDVGEKRVAITGEVKQETEGAWLFSDGVKEGWLPKSRCAWDAERQEMDMPYWMAFAGGFL